MALLMVATDSGGKPGVNRVLIIDSNHTTQEAHAKIWRAQGVNVQTADSVDQAEMFVVTRILRFDHAGPS
jgi:hypothetical protein